MQAAVPSRSKMSDREIETRYVCKICNKQLKTLSNLRCHEETHNERKQHLCEICGKQYTLRRGLREHMATHLVERYTCNICHQTFSSQSTLNAHLRVHTNDHQNLPPRNVFTYRLSLDAKGSYEIVNDDTRQNNDPTSVESDATRPNPDGISSLENNERVNEDTPHTAISKYNDTVPSAKDTKSCDIIKEEDMVLSDPIEAFIMEQAKDTRIDLLSNERVTMNDSETKPDTKTKESGRVYPCSVCNKQFRIPYHLRRHMVTHTGQKPFPCHLCGKRYSQNSSLKDHMAEHTGSWRFTCQICNLHFKRRFRLQAHMLVHTGDEETTETKFHECSICGKKFLMANHLKRHMISHLDTGKVACDICSKQFRNASKLELHVQSAHSDRTHKCDLCGEEFAREVYLKKHILKHDGTPHHVCSFCGKLYWGTDRIEAHIKKCCERSTFSCSSCGKTFASKRGHLQHVQKSHKLSIVDEDKQSLDVHKQTGSASLTSTKFTRHTCNVCTKTFSKASLLKTHMKNHLSEDVYSCKICHASFTNWSGLFKHACGKGESDVAILKNHYIANDMHAGVTEHDCKNGVTETGTKIVKVREFQDDMPKAHKLDIEERYEHAILLSDDAATLKEHGCINDMAQTEKSAIEQYSDSNQMPSNAGFS